MAPQKGGDARLQLGAEPLEGGLSAVGDGRGHDDPPVSEFGSRGAWEEMAGGLFFSRGERVKGTWA